MFILLIPGILGSAWGASVRFLLINKKIKICFIFGELTKKNHRPMLHGQKYKYTRDSNKLMKSKAGLVQFQDKFSTILDLGP